MAKKLRTEAPMDFGDMPERPSRGIQQRISRGETIFSGNPAIPPTGTDTTYLEKNASQRFAEVVQMARQMTGEPNLSTQTVINTLAQQMITDVTFVTDIENSSPETQKKLINLAIAIIQHDYKLTDCSYIYDVDFVPLYGIPSSTFRTRPEQRQQPQPQEEPEQEINTDDYNFEMPNFEVDVEKRLEAEEQFELEKHKRNIINALIQGAAKKYHWVVREAPVRRALDSLNPQLKAAYERIMATNDLLYWTMDDMIQQMSSSGRGAGGSSEANYDEEEDYPEWRPNVQYDRRAIVKYQGGEYLCKAIDGISSNINPEDDDSNWCPKPGMKLTVRATTFVIMVHELAKAVESAIGRVGLPQDPVLAADVMGQTDTMIAEPDQLRLGPKMMEKLRSLLPSEVFNRDSGDLINFFKMEFYKKPAEEFLLIVKRVLSENPAENERARLEFEYILRDAKAAQKKYQDYLDGLDSGDEDDYYGNEDDYGDDDDTPTLGPDDEGFMDLDDLLSGTGIDRPQ